MCAQENEQLYNPKIMVFNTLLLVFFSPHLHLTNKNLPHVDSIWHNLYPCSVPLPPCWGLLLSLVYPICKLDTLPYMVLILDGNSEIDARVRSNLCYLTCPRLLISSRAVTNRIFFYPKRPIFLHACATC